VHWGSLAKPARFVPWRIVQESIDVTDHSAGEMTAKEMFAGAMPACACGRRAEDLWWLCVDLPDGSVGWVSLCDRCVDQVGFVVDPELTEMRGA
jgi:hypothetical protein